jgi:hypothetical protein
MGGTTGVVDIGSDLVRKSWVSEGLIQAKSKSFWSPYTGTSPESIIYQKNATGVKDGHTLIFDYSGNIASEALVGKEQAYGKGTSKKKFSDKISIKRLRWVVDNGDRFEGKNIGDLSINEHADSRAKLADLFVRAKDQFLFDAAQGFIGTSTPNQGDLTNIVRPTSHTVSAGNLDDTDKMGYDFLLELEYQAKTGFGGQRAPILPYQFSGQQPLWILICDTIQITQLKQDSHFQTIVQNADVRGMDNMLLSAIAGKIGNFLIVEAPLFFGSTSSRAIGKSVVEVSGLRRVDENGYITGESGFSTGGYVAARGLIIGKSALRIGYGQLPDYKFQESTDFAITSESLLEVWMNVARVQLTEENEDYVAAKIADMDYGLAAFETVAYAAGELKV